MRAMLDLYSGLGGASEAFVEARWKVIRVENNAALSHVPHTRIADASWAYHLLSHERFDLVWSSPPCLEFSQAFAAPGPTAAREGRDFSPDLSQVEKSWHIIKWLKPRYWCIENVVGAIKHLEPILGAPTQIIGPFVFWHNLPQIVVAREFKHLKKDNDTWSSDPLRSNKKAKVPIEISTAFLEAATLPTLEEF